MKAKMLQETRTANYFQKVVEYKGFKFKFAVTASPNRPQTSPGYNPYHSLCIMLPDGTFKQIADALSVGCDYSHLDAAGQFKAPARYEIVKEIYAAFESYISKIY